jgi:hypothetical protein
VQLVTVQPDATHAEPVVLAGGGLVQLAPHPPQCCALLVVFVSQPFAGLPSQLAKPELQPGAHTPPEHATEPLGLVQVAPHAPQWLVLVLVLVSQPLTRLPSQLPAPAPHDGAQLPLMHDVMPFGFVHLVPQAPQ